MMNNFVYRITMKISYYEAEFEFDDEKEAIDFAKLALAHMITTEDCKERTYLNMTVVDIDKERKAAKEDE